MVDVGGKSPTLRTARARGRVLMDRETFDLVRQDRIKKGNVLTVAQIAGIQGAKSCSQLIPLCHPLSLTKVAVDLALVSDSGRAAAAAAPSHAVEIEAHVSCEGKTGVEMEALAAVSAAALAVFDMCKAAGKGMVIDDIRVVEKTGGKSGTWRAPCQPGGAAAPPPQTLKVEE
ncbi:hypothetical protein H4R18_001909 [Coemansia javaensis]|uniref:cyclic pyranopterin monophosphate synthase n=1 Tax=Coemansia javaensis TaxID=2761396 RepID=A0A9W8LJK1_9FUNG|nr:hypothetical protein H4R18_001909 [Coemansia javaensis]